MPARLKRACRKPGCPGTTTDRSGYCDRCKPSEASWSQWQKKKGSVTERGYGASWRKLRQKILQRDNYLCQECKKNGLIREGRHVDHIITKAAGGSDSTSNLQTLCTICHNHKTATERHRKGEGG